MELGVLTEVENIRDLWKHEQYDFSKWLAEDTNIGLLGNTLGLTLVDVKPEEFVGAYRCNLVATDEGSGMRVIIENQLESSNHDHLGKIITYASGLDAKIIIWIVTRAREEHRSAIEWLNNQTREDLSFFLIEIHAYRIGESLPAPKFEIIEKPNDFIKLTKSKDESTESSQRETERYEFWSLFNERVIERGRPFHVSKPSIRHWYNISTGVKGADICVNLVNRLSCVELEVYISDNKQLFDRLYENKSGIEERLGFEMDWRRLENKKASRIVHRVSGLNFSDHSNYSSLIDEIIDKVTVMKAVFPDFLK